APAAVDPRRARALARRVRAGLGLGQPEAAQPLARAQARQVVALLLLAAPGEDRAAHERGLHRDDGAHRAVAAADLLDDEAVGQVVQARAAVLPRDDRAEVSLLRHERDELAVEALLAGVDARALRDL